MDFTKYHVPGSDAAFYIPDFVTKTEEEYLIRKIRDSPQQKWKQLSNRRLQVWGGEMTSQNILFVQRMPPFINSYPDIIARLNSTGIFKSAGPNHIIINEYLPGQGIMPHEDGSSYHPAVATISLGSHTVFHYYQYTSGTAAEPTKSLPVTAIPGEGRTIDPTPCLSLFLEPRSAIITTSSLYTSHLHGIQEIQEDFIVPASEGEPPSLRDLGVPVANCNMLGEDGRIALQQGGILVRGTRYSLTCRDVRQYCTWHVIKINGWRPQAQMQVEVD